MKKFFQGFTLAETLITVTILGVIVAITVSNIITYIKNRTTEQRLKYVYSAFQNITNIAINETGLEPENWLTEEQKTLSLADKREIIYTQYIFPHIKTNGFNKNTGIFYDNKGIKYTLTGSEYFQNFFSMPNNHVAGYEYLIASLDVDVNGDNGPNEWGKDIFRFTYKVKNKGAWNHSKQASSFEPLSCGQTISGSITFATYKNNAYNYSGTSGMYPACKITSGGDRKCCADMIMREGWKIKSDYPFKY